MKMKPGASALSASIAIIVITAMAILGELVEPFEDLLKALTGNNWVSKGLIGFVVFLVLAVLLSGKEEGEAKGARSLYSPTITTVVCGAIIFLFYVVHYAVT